MPNALLVAAMTAVALNSNLVFAETTAVSEQALDVLKKDYQQRIQVLETRLLKVEQETQKINVKTVEIEGQLEQGVAVSRYSTAQNNFNPAISLILDGHYVSFDNDPDDYELPGFALGGESGLKTKGLSLGESELVMSANIDDKFFGKATLGLHNEEGGTEVDLEEAYIQTTGLGNGLSMKAGRFFLAMGYINEQHAHAWDFADVPLIYRGLFGGQLKDDGLQMSYVAPTDIFLQLGAELFSGSYFPAGGQHNGIGASTVFANFGDDIGIEHSWQLGLSHWQANNIEGRTSGSHAHGGASAVETPSFDGNSQINALDFVYKWAPNGNPKNQQFKFQFEYFEREEQGFITLLNSLPIESTSYNGDQKGWYVQTIYQFKPQWRAGLRYDQVDSNNQGSDDAVLMEVGLDNEGLKPKRHSIMLEWLPSEFSRIRLQLNRDESYETADTQVFLQYTHSMGSHGAHQY